MAGLPSLSATAPTAPNVTLPPPPPALTPQQLQQLVNQPPNAAPPPLLPTAPPSLGPNALPTAPPVGPPGLGIGPPPVPPGLTGPNLGQVPVAKPPATTPGLAPLLPPGLGKGLAGGVLRNPGATPGFGMLPPPAPNLGRRRGAPGSTLRSPAANYTATGAPGGPGGVPSSGLLPPPAGAGFRQRTTPGVPTVRSGGASGVPESFTTSALPPPVSPVLGRSGARRRADNPAPPPAAMRGSFAPPDAAPSVLDATTSRATSGALPPPAGIPPQRPRRGRQAAAGYPGVTGRGPIGPDQAGMPLLPGGVPPNRRQAGSRTPPHLVGNPNWLAETGPDESALAAPVLRNQMAANPETGAAPGVALPAQPGATNPVVTRTREAVRRAMAESSSRPGTRPPAPAEAELARRALEADHHGRPAAQAQEARPGEEAFTVQTPGGPVVGNAGPTRADEAPRPTVNNG
jgi:hypothetical protein